MPNSYEIALADVDKFVARNRTDYEKFLEIVYREIGEYRDLRRISSPIYRIYTRADKQLGGERLKSRLGIAKKLATWRDKENGGGKVPVSKIHDIIGITVVTYFESEVDKVVQALKRARFRNFSVVSEDDIKREDYNANHVVVKQHGKGLGFGGILCEIQIKSLLHDSWSTRTHGIYKDQNRSPKIARRVAALTKLVKSLEEQSDQLRDDLENQGAEDGIKRDAAAIQLLYQLTLNSADQSGDASVSLATQLLSNRDYFSDCTTDDQSLIQILEKWQLAREANGNYQSSCRFMTVFALLRNSRDFDNEALGALDEWLDVATDIKDRARALSFCALTNWALGYLAEAIDNARTLVIHVEQHGMKTSTAKWNLAYYLAEQCYVTKNAQLHVEELDQLVNEAETIEDERQRMSFCDTLGAIKIMTATDRNTIFEGQRLCREAYQWAVKSEGDQPIFQLFYDLHETRAVNRLQCF